MGKYYIGIDVGGTNLKAGLVDETARCAPRQKRPSAGPVPRIL